MQTNQILRAAAKENGIRLWEIADFIGITDGMFSRRLRHELPASEREKLLDAIKEIARQKEMNK